MSLFIRNLSGVDVCFDYVTGFKGTAELKPVDIGLSLTKRGYQFGYVANIPNITSPSLSNQRIKAGFAGCKHFNVSLDYIMERSVDLI